MKPLHHKVGSAVTPIKGVLLGQEMGYRIFKIKIVKLGTLDHGTFKF